MKLIHDLLSQSRWEIRGHQRKVYQVFAQRKRKKNDCLNDNFVAKIDF